MVGLRKLTGIPDLDFYDLRHAFADIARNELYFDKDDVAEALNHVDNNNIVTDIYSPEAGGSLTKCKEM